jgi:GGDEF domain-containing protein
MFRKQRIEDPLPQEPDEPVVEGAVALRDELGLHHSWYFELRLHEEIARAARTGSAFSIVIWEQRVLPGEAPGAEVLRSAAECILSRLRSYSIAALTEPARISALLFDTDATSARSAAHRIKAELQLRAQIGARWQAGLATFGADGDSLEALFQAAAERLAEDGR